jgi:tetratricopeptide (TPR) repeat protein
LLAQAEDQAADRELIEYYSALVEGQRLLGAPDELGDVESFRSAVSALLPRLAPAEALAGPALDGRWLAFELAVVSGDEQALTSRLADLPDAGPPRWRQMTGWAQALWVRGDHRALVPRTEPIDPADRRRRLYHRAAEAVWHLLDGNAEQAVPAVEEVSRLVQDQRLAATDRDLAPGVARLREEVDLLGRAEKETGEADRPGDEPAPAVTAHRLRNAAWRAVAHGRFEEALAHLDDPRHWTAPSWLLDRLRFVAHAYAGQHDAAAHALGRLTEAWPDRMPHRLLAAQWALARNEPAEALERLSGAPDDGPLAFDVRAVRGEALLRLERREEAGRAVDRAAETLLGEGPPGPLLYRPWRLRIDASEWGASSDVAAVADGCHVARLCLEADRLEEALPVLRRAENRLPSECESACRWMGETLEATALRFVLEQRFDVACDLRRRGQRYIGIDKLFAESLADAIRERPPAEAAAEPELSDAVLEQFLVYTELFEGPPAEFGRSGPGDLVARGARIDDDRPPTDAELERRESWSRRFAEAYPGWPWSHRNLARARLRQDDPAGCHAALTSIPDRDRDGEDDWLDGHASWCEQRFAEAAESFDHAVARGFRVPEAAVLRGTARAVDGWIHRPGEPIDSKLVLEDLDPETLRAAGVPGESVEQAVIIRATVLLAADRLDEAGALLDGFMPASQPAAIVAAIQGLVEVRRGRLQRAIECFERGSAAAPAGDDVNVLLLWARLAQPGYAGLPGLREAALELHRGGRCDRIHHLLCARVRLRSGCLEEAEAAFRDAADAAPRWHHLPLAVLNAQVERERQLVEARLHLARGEIESAARSLREINDLWLGRERLRLLRALAACHGGEPDAARAGLRELAEGNDVDATALLAVVALEGGDATEASSRVEQALALEADHPVARLVAGRLSEARGNGDEATTHWDRVVQAGDHVPPELRAAAHLALGRQLEHCGEHAEAQRHYQAARDVDPRQGVAVGRLVALAARTGEAIEEALDAFDGTTMARPTVRGLLARAMLADRARQPERLAEALGALVRHPGHGALDPRQQTAIARWSAHVHLQLEQFGEASEAIRVLVAQEESPELSTMLVDCRLLQAGRLLREDRPGPDDLEAIAQAADDVLEERPDHALAILLAATARLLLGRAGHDEHAALVDRLGEQAWESPQMRLIVEINRLFVSPEGVAQVDELIKQEHLEDSERAYLQLLAANQRGDAPRLLALAQRALAKRIEEAECFPVDRAELTEFAAQMHLAQGRNEAAERLLRTLHEQGLGRPESRRLHALVLGRMAIDLIEQQDVFTARDRLDRARELLEEPTVEVV